MEWATANGPVTLSLVETILENPPEFNHNSSTRIELLASRGGKTVVVHRWDGETRPVTCWFWPRVVDAIVRSDNTVLVRYRGESPDLDADSRVLLRSTATGVELVRAWHGRRADRPDELRHPTE